MVQAMEKSWQQAHNLFQTDAKLHSHAPIWHNVAICVDRHTMYWNIWQGGGIRTIDQLISRGDLKPFDSLQEDFHLPISQK